MWTNSGYTIALIRLRSFSQRSLDESRPHRKVAHWLKWYCNCTPACTCLPSMAEADTIFERRQMLLNDNLSNWMGSVLSRTTTLQDRISGCVVLTLLQGAYVKRVRSLQPSRSPKVVAPFTHIAQS